MRKEEKKIGKKYILGLIVVVGVLLVLVGTFYSSYAYLEPVKSISFTSEKLNYERKESGSFKIENSAKWIEKGKARITIDIDTIERIKNRYTDIIFVLDISSSMAGEKLQKAKVDIKELFDSLLAIEGNKGAFITFDTNSEIL